MNKRKLIITTLLFSSLMSINAAAQTDVHVLDVGQGLSVLIESSGHYMLYDGGDSDKSSYVISYLHQEGVTALDYVVASHYDSDHLNGVVGALNTFPVSTVWGPDYETGTRVFESFRSVIAAKGLSWLRLQRCQQLFHRNPCSGRQHQFFDHRRRGSGK